MTDIYARDAVIAAVVRGEIPASLLAHEPNPNDPNVVGAQIAAGLIEGHPFAEASALLAAQEYPDNNLIQLMAQTVHHGIVPAWVAMMGTPSLKADIDAQIRRRRPVAV